MRKMIALLLVLLWPLSALAEELTVVTVRTTWPDDTSITRMENIPAAEISLEIDLNMLVCGVAPENETWYDLTHEYGPSELVGFDVHCVTHVDKYEGETLLWRRDITDYRVEKAWEMSEGVLLWGTTDSSLDYYGVPQTHWLSLLSHDGEVLWSHPMTEWAKLDDLDVTLDNGDGTWTIFGTAGYNREKQLLMKWLSEDGTELRSCCIPLTNIGLEVEQLLGRSVVWASRNDEGYLLHLRRSGYGYECASYILQVRPDGTVAQVLSYDGDRNAYTWEDVCLIGGDLWLSGYAVPLESYEEALRSTRTEINHILTDAYNRCFGQRIDLGLFTVDLGAKPVTSEWLTPRLQANYTALLLRCDALTGDVLAAYTVPGCLGASLVQDVSGGVLWDVHHFADSFYSPATSSFTIGATMQVYRCGVDGQNGVRWVMDAGEHAQYRR